MIVTVSGFSADNGWEHSSRGAQGAQEITHTHAGLGGAGRGDVAAAINAISGSDCSYFSPAPVHYDSYLQTRVTPLAAVSGHSAYCSAALRPRPWVPPGSGAAEEGRGSSLNQIVSDPLLSDL